MKNQPTLSDHEVLTGLVERITYQNAENGFCVIRIKARGHRERVTLVGHAAAISAASGSRQPATGSTTLAWAPSMPADNRGFPAPILTALLGRGPRKPGVHTYSSSEPCTRVASNYDRDPGTGSSIPQGR